MFFLKKLEIPQYFLVIESHHQANGTLLLTQSKYIKYLLSKVNMTEAKGVATLMLSQCELRKHDTDVILDPLIYRITISAF